MARSVDEIQTMFDIVDGQDERDSNSLEFEPEDIPKSLKGVRVGVVNEFNINELPQSHIDNQYDILQRLQDQGAIIVPDISIPLMKEILWVYYTLVPAEAASNLARYDGLKYAGLPFDSNLSHKEYMEKVRTEGFGVNVKRRIALGNFVLSTQDVDYNEMFLKAQKIRRVFW